ncbi:MAG: hypothetical protein BWY31_03767 [Lentisphaerae bacterium ADurb.Bin242]|nr:MAG: hypothetical protein BWY31_03767 [Lentisphaerae bacterium ADurb.Bin242]
MVYCREVVLEFISHRLYCRNCHSREMEHIPFLSHPKSRLTQSLERTILELQPHLSVQAVARHFHVLWHTVKDLEKRDLKRKYARIQTAHVKAVGIYEIHIGRAQLESQYLTIVRDLNFGAVIHVGDGKGTKDLEGALRKLKRSKLRMVTMDMSNA